MVSFNDVLIAAKEYCKNQMVDATYRLYIEKLQLVSFEDSSIITLSIEKEFLCGIVNDRYLNLLRDAFKSVLGFEAEVRVISPEEPAAPPVALPAEELSASAQSSSVKLPSGRYDFTFENFIKGPSNQFTLAAAQAVANNPAYAYNPLFIWGSSGLGKTHLLNAIQIEIRKNHPDFNIVYVDCEKFTNEIITAIRSGSTEEFRQKYRQADLLLVDDIQFIAGKESTQEEFFHTFNTLHNAGKQIVLACDRPAKEIKTLDDRLRTRFEWGLTADIQPPDYETRVAIIRRKAELLGLELPDEVVEYIANNLKNNIRQLEGAVKKLNAYYMLEGISPVIGVAQNAIRDILSETQPVPITVEKIISEVARTYSVSAADIRSAKRNSAVAAARRTAIYVIREITGMSMEDIGKEVGGRDHSTIVYSLKVMSKSIQTDTRLRETVEDIIKNVRT